MPASQSAPVAQFAGFDIRVLRSAHPTTLRAWVEQRLRSGLRGIVVSSHPVQADSPLELPPAFLPAPGGIRLVGNSCTPPLPPAGDRRGRRVFRPRGRNPMGLPAGRANL